VLYGHMIDLYCLVPVLTSAPEYTYSQMLNQFSGEGPVFPNVDIPLLAPLVRPFLGTIE
jgi:hypothetical protein